MCKILLPDFRIISHSDNNRNLARSNFVTSTNVQRCSVWNRIAEIDVKSVNIFMTRTTRPDRERRIPRSREGRVVSHPVYNRAGISRRMINLPSRFEPPSYRRGYFNILKFHPKRAVYQNLRHKLRAAIPPTPLANPPDILHPPAEIARCPGLRRTRFTLALSFSDVEKINDQCLITVELIQQWNVAAHLDYWTIV